jgi:hypothetical protein
LVDGEIQIFLGVQLYLTDEFIDLAANGGFIEILNLAQRRSDIVATVLPDSRALPWNTTA